jgi:hypothetical protein
MNTEVIAENSSEIKLSSTIQYLVAQVEELLKIMDVLLETNQSNVTNVEQPEYIDELKQLYQQRVEEGNRLQAEAAKAEAEAAKAEAEEKALFEFFLHKNAATDPDQKQQIEADI